MALKEGERGHDSIGILPAIREFMNNNPEWKVLEDRKNNNGLLILGREFNVKFD